MCAAVPSLSFHGAARLQAIVICSIVRAGDKVICCNDSMSATTPFFGSGWHNRRAARADRESVARLDAVLETIVDQQEALLVRMLRGCAQAVVDAPLAQKLALREDFAWMELDVMKQCSALFDARRPRPRSRAGSIIPERLSASQAASWKQQQEARREQNDDECLKAAELRWRVAKAANNTAAVAAAREACRASKDVVAAKPGDDERLLYIFGPDHDKKRLRALRAERERAANAARCQCPSTCVLVGMVPSCRRL